MKNERFDIEINGIFLSDLNIREEHKMRIGFAFYAFFTSYTKAIKE